MKEKYEKRHSSYVRLFFPYQNLFCHICHTGASVTIPQKCSSYIRGHTR